MFRGQFEHSIDAKGRTSLPARYRELLAARGSDRLVITTDVEPCLLAFPLDHWQAFEAKLAALPALDQRVKLVKRIYVGSAHEVSIDGAGRILIPPTLREYAGLGKEALFTGLIDRVEVWSRDGWQTNRERASGEDFQQIISDLGI
jgi:MraZ protein